MIGINGGQINALFLLPPVRVSVSLPASSPSALKGSTCASVFAMRWTDQNFGYVYHSWLKLRGVRPRGRRSIEEEEMKKEEMEEVVVEEEVVVMEEENRREGGAAAAGGGWMDIG
eukprot:766600-Hanusia_phi.AAC.2